MLRKVLAILALWAAATAQAAQFDFQYTTDSSDVFSGSLMGTLQADNNTIVVTSILDFVQLNGADLPAITFVESFEEFVGGPSADPTVSLNGAVMDMIACTAANCGDGFLFAVLGESGIDFSSSEAFGDFFGEAFVASRWQIQAANGVPEPGTLALLGLGLAGLAASRRRKQ